jgi:tetratricopeptide (TPR) repeat protein
VAEKEKVFTMNFRRYLIILAFFLVTALVVQPAVSLDDITSVVTNHTAGNVTKIVTNQTSDLEKDSANQYYNYGVQSLSQGDTLAAIKFFDQALAENTTMIKKTDAILYLYQGKSYALIKLERYNDAIAAADEGLGMYPRDAMLWNNKGFAHYSLGKQQEALLAYTTAVSYDGNYTNAYLNEGNVLSDMGRYSEAVAAYTRANETDPFNTAAYDGLVAAQKGESESGRTTTLFLVVIIIAAAGIGIWYTKFRKPAEPAPEATKKSKKK